MIEIFKLVPANRLEIMEERIIKYLNKGFILQGSISITSTCKNGYVYYLYVQPMIKES